MRFLFLLSGVVLAQGAISEEEAAEFDRFVEKFGKVYQSQEELEKRRDIFAENYRRIQETNSKKLPYQLGVQEFADLTREEFADLRLSSKGFYKSREAFLAKGPKAHLYSGSQYPASVDLREQGAVTPVKNQGNCGSCWAFSATGAIEGRMKIHKKAPLTSLSEAHLMHCSWDYGNQGCDGGFMDQAFAFAKDHGVCAEADYPYVPQDGKCTTTCTPAVRPHEIVDHASVDSNVDALKEAVSQGPVSVAVSADDNWMFYTGGILSGECGGANHGVLLVGYGTDEDGQEYWLVKNSWGESWGEEGYIRISQTISEGTGDFCILGYASYPVIPTNGM